METFMRGLADWLVGWFGPFGIMILLMIIFFWWMIPIVALMGIAWVCCEISDFIAWARRGFKRLPKETTSYSYAYSSCGSSSSSDDDDTSSTAESPPDDQGPTPDYWRGY